MFILIRKVTQAWPLFIGKKEAFDLSITWSFQYHHKTIAVVSNIQHNLVAPSSAKPEIELR